MSVQDTLNIVIEAKLYHKDSLFMCCSLIKAEDLGLITWAQYKEASLEIKDYIRTHYTLIGFWGVMVLMQITKHD